MKRKKLKQSEIEFLISLYERANGTIAEAYRIITQEPYITRGLSFSYTAIQRYWREAGLRIRGKGGANTLGKTWKCKKHNIYEFAKEIGLIEIMREELNEGIIK